MYSGVSRICVGIVDARVSKHVDGQGSVGIYPLRARLDLESWMLVRTLLEPRKGAVVDIFEHDERHWAFALQMACHCLVRDGAGDFQLV